MCPPRTAWPGTCKATAPSLAHCSSAVSSGVRPCSAAAAGARRGCLGTRRTPACRGAAAAPCAAQRLEAAPDEAVMRARAAAAGAQASRGLAAGRCRRGFTGSQHDSTGASATALRHNARRAAHSRPSTHAAMSATLMMQAPVLARAALPATRSVRRMPSAARGKVRARPGVATRVSACFRTVQL
jgi:hypothetical protein